MVNIIVDLGQIKRGSELGKKDIYHRYVYVECPICHKRRWSRFNKIRHYPFIRCLDCLSGPGPNHAAWKGGRHYIRGYYRIIISKDDPYFPMADTNNYLFEHRYIMAKYLGRCLMSWELVHHKNGDKGDNRIENLEIISHLRNISASIFDNLQNQEKRIEQLENRVILLEAENIVLREINMLTEVTMIKILDKDLAKKIDKMSGEEVVAYLKELQDASGIKICTAVSPKTDPAYREVK